MRRLLGGLLRNVRTVGRDSALKTLHLPEDMRSPSRIFIYSGPGESDVWPALYLSCSLQRVYRETDLFVICREEDSRLFAMLDWKPGIVTYDGRPSMPVTKPEETPDQHTLLFHPYLSLKPDAISVLRGSRAGIRISPAVNGAPEVNITVRTGVETYPAVLYRMCEILGITPDTDWKPMMPKQIQEKVAGLMAPVSGRTLPYIAATQKTINILEKHRAEIPLRTVSIIGKNAELQGLDRETRAAVTAGASAVVTDDPGLWADARALGVATVGLDSSGSFLPWSGEVPATSEREFIESWARLLRRGW